MSQGGWEPGTSFSPVETSGEKAVARLAAPLQPVAGRTRQTEVSPVHCPPTWGQCEPVAAGQRWTKYNKVER